MYATQAIVVAANQALHAAGSVVKLYILQGVPSVNALRAADGSEVNPAVALYQIAYLDGHSTELLKKPLRETIQDCNGMVMQVMGELDGNPTVFVDGKYRRCASVRTHTLLCTALHCTALHCTAPKIMMAAWGMGDVWGLRCYAYMCCVSV